MKRIPIVGYLFVASAVSSFYFMAEAVRGQELERDRPSTSRSRNEEAIRQVLARFEEAFEKRDARICAREFIDYADWENASGNRAGGRADIEKRLTRIYTDLARAKQQIVELRIRFVTSDVAVADVDREIFGHAGAENGKKLPATRVRTTHVLRRKKGNWQVVVSREAQLRQPDLVAGYLQP